MRIKIALSRKVMTIAEVQSVFKQIKFWLEPFGIIYLPSEFANDADILICKNEGPNTIGLGELRIREIKLRFSNTIGYALRIKLVSFILSEIVKRIESYEYTGKSLPRGFVKELERRAEELLDPHIEVSIKQDVNAPFVRVIPDDKAPNRVTFLFLYPYHCGHVKPLFDEMTANGWVIC